jgi:hypothetical protein
LGWIEKIGDKMVACNVFRRNDKRVLLIYGIGFQIKAGSREEREARSIGESYLDVDEVEVITYP